MPEDMLASLLHAALPWVSPQGRAIIDALAPARDRIASPSLLAVRLGFRDRHHLARMLRREGLPPYAELAAWTRLLAWTVAWEDAGTSLSRSALDTLTDPAVCYRAVKRLTGIRWREVCKRGTPWVLAQLRDRCRIPPAVRPSPAVGEAIARRVSGASQKRAG